MNAGIPPPFPTVVPGYLPTDPQATVPGDLPCRKCSYNLRGLSVNGRCPECGTPVGLSMSSDRLRFSDPNWLTLLRRGISMILLAYGINFIIIFLSLTFFRGNRSMIYWLTVVETAPSFYGRWLLTEHDPARVSDPHSTRTRRLIRVTASVVLGLRITRAGLTWIDFGQLGPLLGATVGLITGLTGAVGEVAVFFYLQRLAQRIPDRRLIDWADALKWIYGPLVAITSLTSLLMFPWLRTISPSAAIPLGCFGLLLLVSVLGLELISLVFLIRFRGALSNQIAQAEQVWQKGLIAADTNITDQIR